MADIPSTMRALVVPGKVSPEAWELRDMPTPSITEPQQVLIRMRASGMNTGEILMSAGKMSIFNVPDYPFIIGQEGSGTVLAVGSGVKNLKIGDDVYGLAVVKPLFQIPPPNLTAQYAVIHDENLLLKKPDHISFEAAASFAGFTCTAYQVIRRGLQRHGEDSLEGKTVFVPGGLSGTGSIIIQVAKNVFGASKIITTVSTSKVALVEKYLPGLVDQVVDYKTQKVQDVVPPGSVDFAVNTQFSSMHDCIAVLNPKTGNLMSITSAPSPAILREMMGPRYRWYIGLACTLAGWYYSWLTWGTNLKHEMVSGGPHIREDLEKAGEFIALGKVKPVIRIVELEDIEKVRSEAMAVYTGKGGLGKMVIQIP